MAVLYNAIALLWSVILLGLFAGLIIKITIQPAYPPVHTFILAVSVLCTMRLILNLARRSWHNLFSYDESN